MSQSRRESGASSLLGLGLVLLALLGAGGWNYQRNLRIEALSRATRPLAGYATADLEALASAYQAEVTKGTARYESTRDGRAKASERRYFDEQVREFEKVQRASNRSREAGADLSERETALRQVEAELAVRGPGESVWQRHWRRLVSY